MKWIIGFDDGTFYHNCVVEAPHNAELITLFEIALSEFNCGDYISKDYYESGAFYNELLRRGWSQDDARWELEEFQYSEKLGKYIRVVDYDVRPAPPNAVPGYTHGKHIPDLYARYQPAVRRR